MTRVPQKDVPTCPKLGCIAVFGTSPRRPCTLQAPASLVTTGAEREPAQAGRCTYHPTFLLDKGHAQQRYVSRASQQRYTTRQI